MLEGNETVGQMLSFGQCQITDAHPVEHVFVKVENKGEMILPFADVLSETGSNLVTFTNFMKGTLKTSHSDYFTSVLLTWLMGPFNFYCSQLVTASPDRVCCIVGTAGANRHTFWKIGHIG